MEGTDRIPWNVTVHMVLPYDRCGEGVQGPLDVTIPRTAATAKLKKINASIAICQLSFYRLRFRVLMSRERAQCLQ